jgi:hypothetical protein
MQSTLTARDTDPHDIFLIEPDVVLAARVDKAPSNLAHDAMSRPSAPQADIASGVLAGAAPPPVDTTFRAAAVDNIQVPGDQPAIGKWTNRVLMSLFALCSAVAAAAWQHYGDTAKQMIANWAPPFVMASSPPAEKPPLAEQPGSPVIQPAAADQAAAQPAPPAQPSKAAAPTVAASSPEATQSLQSMARDLASMGQQIEQLKANIEQLKAGQEQMSRDMAKNSEAKASAHSVQPRISAPPQRSAAAPAPRKPRPAFSPAQAVAAPISPPPQAAAPSVPLQPEPPPQATAQEGEPVVRPPMPLR